MSSRPPTWTLKSKTKTLAAKTKEETAASVSRNSTKDSIEAEERKLQTQQKSIRDGQGAVEENRRYDESGAMFLGLKTAVAIDSKVFADVQEKFRAVTARLLTYEDGEASMLENQRITTKQTHAQHNADYTTDYTDYTKDKQLFDHTEASVKKLTAVLVKIQYEDGSLETLPQLTYELRKLNIELDRWNAHTWDLQ
jgi:hypothetical protein